MTIEEQKNKLLEDFQHYLHESNLDLMQPHEQPDLHTLLSEMVGLKTEVKAESRQFKKTLDTLSGALETVQEDNRVLSTEHTLMKERLDRQQQEMMRTMLLDMIDIYVRIDTSVVALKKHQPVASLFKSSRKKDIHFIEKVSQGQNMTARRFKQILQSYQVTEIECLGKLLNPLTMSAIETSSDTALETGIVVEVLQQGFLFQDKVLRLAEVRVNKI